MRKGVFILVFMLAFLLAVPLFADTREVHRASNVGGTGMMFQRIGDQLDYKEMNLSLWLEYIQWDDQMPLNPRRVGQKVFVDDPLGDEIWLTLTYNYGLNDIVELGVQLPVVINDNPGSFDYEVEYDDQTYTGSEDYIDDIRDTGLGRIGVDARFLILNKARTGAGISGTIWMTAPSFTDNVTSDDFNAGIELNFTLEGHAFTNYFGSEAFDRIFLEKMTSHMTLGWGFDDYLEFEEYDPQPEPANEYNSRDPRKPQFVAAEHIKASFGIEYEVYDLTNVGMELLWKQYVNEYRNDNSVVVIFPEVSYTYQDKFTVSAAFGMSAFFDMEDRDNRPEMLGKIGFTYHFPTLYAGRVDGASPARPQDLFEIFVPSRKPIPVQTGEEEEVPLDDTEDVQ